MTTCTIEHHRDGECIERWNVSERMIQRDGDMARVVFPVGRIVLASYDELHFCLPDVTRVLSEVREK